MLLPSLLLFCPETLVGMAFKPNLMNVVSMESDALANSSVTPESGSCFNRR